MKCHAPHLANHQSCNILNNTLQSKYFFIFKTEKKKKKTQSFIRNEFKLTEDAHVSWEFYLLEG